MAHRFLVTGCAGFIASNVARLLLEDGHEVVGIDNLNSAYDPRLKQWRLSQLERHLNFHFQPMDITDREALASLFDDTQTGTASRDGGAPFHAIFNLAARAGVRPSVETPDIYFDVNTSGTLNLLELCRQHQIRKFILASTSSAYGGNNPVPYAEDANTDRPLSPYASSKKAAETLAYSYHHLHGIDVSVLRYFTVYGPAGRPDMSVFRFVRRIAERETIVVFGDGQQQRDFTYVDDIARGTVAAVKSLGYEIINLGGDRPVALSLVIEKISELVDRPAQIEYRPAHPADVERTWADISKARRLLDWSPRVPLADGLGRAVEWYRNHRKLALSLELGDAASTVKAAYARTA